MKKLSQIVLVPAFVLPLAAVACGASDSSVDGGRAGGGSSGAAQAGSVAQAGALAQAGSVSAAGGSSGRVESGGASASGASSVGGTSGSSAGGSPAAGGTAGVAGAAALAGSGGTGGATDSKDVASALDGLRVDDPCAGTPDTSNGAVCNHVVLTAGGFKSAKEATIAGTSGTTYDVTLRIRGIVEPMQIDGGMRPDTTTFKYQNMTWRKVPFTIGGTVNRGDYSQWRITVASPKQEYFLNDYQTVGHYIFQLDYQVTIQVAANSKVTLDGADSNERQIVNYEKYALEGIAGSMNFGQFIQCNVVSVKPH
ncbi:MAG TPA: hypothetical protein VJV79_02705 [Polyangiaceae bacterium]|nr:hypothetical protein [Polyangiaceae bacterium]